MVQHPDESFLAEQFPQDQELCYLNHAAVSPWPQCAKDAVVRFADENVTFGAAHYPKWLEVETACLSGLRSYFI